MYRSQAIKAHCKECSGGTADEVTGCSLFDCPLWPFRLGSGVDTPAYKNRVRGFFGKANNIIVQELAAEGLTAKDYLKSARRAIKVSRTKAQGDAHGIHDADRA